MTSLTIQGHAFEIPEGLLAKYAVGYTLAEEGEAHAMRQTLSENLRNNFANKVKTALGEDEELSDEKLAELRQEFTKYATEYRFGVRGAGEGKPRLDPLTRKMYSLAKADFIAAFKAKFNTKPDADLIDERVEQLIDKRRAEYNKRAREILKQEGARGEATLEAVGL